MMGGNHNIKKPWQELRKVFGVLLKEGHDGYVGPGHVMGSVGSCDYH